MSCNCDPSANTLQEEIHMIPKAPMSGIYEEKGDCSEKDLRFYREMVLVMDPWMVYMIGSRWQATEAKPSNAAERRQDGYRLHQSLYNIGAKFESN